MISTTHCHQNYKTRILPDSNVGNAERYHTILCLPLKRLHRSQKSTTSKKKIVLVFFFGQTVQFLKYQLFHQLYQFGNTIIKCFLLYKLL